jgi:hypothetical protein
MAWDDISLGDWGEPGRVTLTQGGTAFDASNYDTIIFLFKAPGATSFTSKTGAFLTDGSDGVCTYTIEENLFNVAGTWTLHVRISSDTRQLTSRPLTFEVEHV